MLENVISPPLGLIIPPTLFFVLTALLVPFPVSCTAIAANSAGSMPYFDPIEENISPVFLRAPPRLLFNLAPLAVAVGLITPPAMVPHRPTSTRWLCMRGTFHIPIKER